MRTAWLAPALLLTACSSASGLPNGEYLSTVGSTFDLVARTTVRLSVDEQTLGLSAGCNSMSADYRIEAGTLVADDIASTEMGCPPKLAEQDQRLISLLTSRPEVTESADGFTVTGPDGNSLTFVQRSVADPDRPLERTRWVLDGITNGDVAWSAAGFDSVSLRFDEGVLAVNTACWRGKGEYSIDGTSLDVGALSPEPISDTRCPAGVRDAETAIKAVMSEPVTVDIQADTLELRGDQRTLTLRAS